MSPNASSLQVSPNLHCVLHAGHGLQYVFGYILLAMHNVQSVPYEEVLHIQKGNMRFYTTYVTVRKWPNNNSAYDYNFSRLQ